MRVFISACGEGFGHSSRMLSLYNEVEKRGGHASIATYGAPLKHLKSLGVRTIATRPEIRMTGADGRFDLVGSIIRSRGTPFDVAKAFLLERQAIKNSKASVVVSDTRFATILAGFSLGLPCFLVSNQTYFILPREEEKARHRSILEKMFGAREISEAVLESLIEVPLSLPYPFANEVLVPDFMPPHALCSPLISHEHLIRRKTRFVGPMTSLASHHARPAGWQSGKTRVLATFGGQNFRQGEFERLLSELKRMNEFDFLATSQFAKRPVRSGNVRVTPFLKSVFPYMAAADLLVMPAGHSAIMESIMMHKPALLLPDANWPEQQSNAKRYEQLGLGLHLSPMHLDKMPRKLAELKQRRHEFIPNLRKLAHLASGVQNGARNVADICQEFSRRLP